MLKIHRTFLSSKYLSMLLSGTVLMILTSAMCMADTLIAGIVLGEDAVSGVCLVLPVYSLASFFSVAFSYGVPILYSREIGAFLQSYHPGSRVLAYAEEYLSWLKFTVLILPLNELLDGMVFADGDEKITLAAHTSSRIHMIALSYNRNALEIH